MKLNRKKIAISEMIISIILLSLYYIFDLFVFFGIGGILGISGSINYEIYLDKKNVKHRKDEKN